MTPTHALLLIHLMNYDAPPGHLRRHRLCDDQIRHIGPREGDELLLLFYTWHNTFCLHALLLLLFYTWHNALCRECIAMHVVVVAGDEADTLLLWQAMKLGEEAAERVTETFVKPIKLEFEKVNHTDYINYTADYTSDYITD